MTGQLIHQVVTRFYQKATTDFLIGHQFRKIAEFKGNHPLAPPIEAFSHHIPRIVAFWHIQLNIKITDKQDHLLGYDKSNLLKAHEYLNIKKGELGRWVVLFLETIEEFELQSDQNDKIFDQWKLKIKQFESTFSAYFFKS